MTALYITLSVILLLLALLLGTAAVMSIVYRRSLMSSLVDIYIRIIQRKKSRDKEVLALEKLRLAGSEPEKIKAPLSKHVTEENFSGMQIFSFRENTSPASEDETVILYLFGGAYFRAPLISHIRFLHRLSKKSGLTVKLPIYPRIPYHTYSDTLNAVYKYYMALSRSHSNIIIMGDSSGGGLALLLMQHLRDRGERNARAAILLSPWVDLSLSDKDIELYEKRDPLISISGSLKCAEAFSGGLNLRDSRISPAYGDFSSLPGFHLFVGDRELLFPEINSLHLALLRSGIDHGYTVGRGMNHVYPIYPIPEAVASMKQIMEIIKR